MEQTSKLGIVVDTTRAQAQLKEFTRQLKLAHDAGLGLISGNQRQAQSYNLVNTGLRNNAQFLQQASRAATANSKAAVAAKLNQDKLAISASKVAMAASKAAEASARAQAAIANLAAAGSRADAAMSGAAAATARAAGASSNAAAAASRAAAAQDRASAAAVRLASAEARAAAEADRLAGGLGRANGQAHGFMGTLNSLQGLLMGGMFSIATLGIVKTADEMQNLNSQIKLVTKSEEEYLGIRQKVREIADANFNDVKATTGLYTNSARALANLGKSQAEALDFTNAVSLAMRAGGRSAGEQASAILQLGQAMGANVVQGDEFRSIAENAPILLELVAKRLGVLPGQLKALAADGKITGEVMFDALTQNVNMLEDMAKKMPLTMAQAFAVAKNRYKSYVDDMMNQTGGMSGKIAKMIEGMSANFDTLAKVAIAGVGLAFLQMAGTINVATKAMAVFNLVTSANPLVLTVTTVIAVASAFYGLNDVLGVSSILFGDFFSLVNSGWVSIGEVVAKITGQTTKDVDDSNKANTQSYLGFFKESEKGFTGFVQNIAGALATITATFRALFSYIENGMADALNAMGNGVINTFNWVSEQAAKIGIGDGSQTNKIPYRNVSARDAFSYYNTPLQAGIQTYFSGVSKRNDAKNAVPVPYAPSTDPMDEIKKSQFEQMKANDALEEATKAAAKEAKERAKRERELNKGLTNRLVGISGDTGVGNAHLHIQYRDKSRAVSPADLARFKANGKALTDYKMTSGYGKRNTGIKGASTNHKGTDFGIPKNTPITTNVAVKNVKTWKDGKGGGYVSTITFEDGVVIDLLHQMPSVMGVDKGSSTGNKQIDSMVAKAENAVAKEAAKAEKERIKAAEAAQKERDRIDALRLKLIKEYGDKELQLTMENDERIAEIKDAGFNSTKQAELIKQSEQQMSRELAVYKKGLDDKVNELVKFQKTERDLLKQQYNDDVFSIVSDPELSRPENSERMKEALANARLLNDYRLSLYEQSLEQEKSAMYAFQKTERQILIDEGMARLANAKLQQDELSAYRVEAVEAEEAYKLNIFDANQSLKMLDLKKSHMSAMQYIRERYALEQQLINLGNEPDDVKALQLEALRAPAKDALKGMLEGIEQQSPMAKIRAEYEANLLILEEYEQKYTDMIGVQTEARLAIEQSYMNAKRDLFLTQGEELFGALAGLSKSFVGEQAGTYRLLYGIQKGFAVASAGIALWQSVSEASKAPIPAKWGLMAAAAADGAKLVSTITSLQPQGFKQGGYTGNAGTSQVAGVVHGQEYVFDAQATKRIGVDNLNAMRSGKAPTGGDVNITVNNMSSAKVETQKDDNGNIIMTIREEIKKSWASTGNPNSFESKQLNRNLQAPRRR